MYKLMIVDDEELICKGLSELMEWSELGFELITTHDDGKDAIEHLQQEPIDVVLTDIKMTHVSGLELAKFVHENIPRTKVVINSGYREFDYAKQAVEYDVVHYLLKPTQFDEIERVFKQIKRELDRERLAEAEEDGHLDLVEMIHVAPSEYLQRVSHYKLFMSIILDGDADAVNGQVAAYFQEMNGLPLGAVRHIVIDLFAVLTHQFMEMGTDIWGVTRSMVDHRHILKMKGKPELQQWCESAFLDIIRCVNQNTKSSSDNVIMKALEYMERNYSQNISLEDVADRVFLNPVYFSRLFRQQVGETFTQYLTRIRMEKAMQLLKENRYKTYVVGEKVGYSNCKYFTRVFKQFTGYTTTEYMKRQMELETAGHEPK